MSAPLYRHIKLFLGLGLFLALLVLLAAVLVASEAGLSLWQQLQKESAWLLYSYASGLGLFILLSIFILWQFLKPTKQNRPAKNPTPPTEETVKARIIEASEAGIDVEAAQVELERLSQRQAAGEVHVAVFGDISTGKSTLIKALAEVDDIAISVEGGTTRAIQHYSWHTPAGDKLVLTDMPGLNEATGRLDGMSQEEALRAHVVIYVCDGDLTASQFTELQVLLNLNKPLVIAINKSDRYNTEALELISDKLRQRTNNKADIALVKAGGTEEITRVHSDGREETITRTLKSDLASLKKTLQHIIDTHSEILENLRDSTVFMLVAHKLERSENAHRKTQAETIVKNYTRKAVVGALAAVSPGTDIIIQGYLGISMLKELCTTFDITARKLDMERFLDLSQSHLGKTTPLLLAVIGNGLKAFPGIGTLAGGIVHAVAYGIIFETLGRSVIQTLERRGELLPEATANSFKENLSENLEARTQRFVGLALEAARNNKP